jgi:hypothetical protein
VGASAGVTAVNLLEPTMAVDVLTERVIARPLAEVAAFAADPTPGTSLVRQHPVGGVGHAAARDCGLEDVVCGSLSGRRLAYTYEVVELVPETRLVMRTAEGPFPMETTYTWEAVPGGTRMTLRNRGEPTGFSRWVAPLMATMMRRANEADLRLLQRVLEEAAG